MLFIAALYSSFRFIIPMNPSPDLAGGEKIQTETVFYIHKTQFHEMSTDGEEREISVYIWVLSEL